ncbi:3-phosphoshikimate 1-carboxyvinyltransferase [candidate division KSB3 bacterium]|uniref:3-phosphoshikimate 1-carboxyvinyltransferase n=1 Tax=candidate division KSB3 bacterium TaxID=2044937 RepID=A0A9D5JYE3_9BACT|nr:3-phosphoshikimate 1-carboxyvinyltransferase [candidate division KSB3 bacterium]MBD3326619.1 3-phosphoshikimate 1-carboxyvinyltransferase [candidate division KSB3 bacterium]
MPDGSSPNAWASMPNAPASCSSMKPEAPNISPKKFMTKFITPAHIKGTLRAPSSKSEMLRAVAAAYLTEKPCGIVNPSYCDDANAALGIIETLGVQLEMEAERVRCTPAKPATHPSRLVLDCQESGLCIRMFPSIAALREGEVTLTGHGSLTSRPLRMIEAPLRDLGVQCRTNEGFPPVTVQGPLHAGTTTVDASTTSQFLTGLLMALPLCKGTSEIRVTSLRSSPYIAVTLNLLEKFGIQIEHDNFERFLIKGPQRYQVTSYHVDGDWSGAAFLLVAGAIAGDITVENLHPASSQADRAILTALDTCGATVEISDNAVRVHQRPRPLYGFTFDATDCPDLFPPLVALASCCEGTSIIYGAQRLKVKESDRGTALLTEFTKMGASLALHPDRIEITGNLLDGGTVHSYNDHRIAMACAVAGLRSRQGVTIQDWECVSKSYPAFFEDLQRVMEMP